MGRKLKCLYCGKEIDTSIDEYQKVNSTRYAHLSCVEKELKKPKPKPKEKPKTQKEIIKEINDFLANHFGDAADYGKTNRLLKAYLKEGMTASGILKTLEYYYDIKKHSIAESGGSIGIVPYVYKDAKDFARHIVDTEGYPEENGGVQTASGDSGEAGGGAASDSAQAI